MSARFRAVDSAGVETSLPDRSVAPAKLRSYHLLDALRGLAAVAVVLFHTSFIYGVKPPAAFLAVDLFFVMSGFIIAHRYDADIRGGLGVRRFVILRLIRLYPLYLLGAILGLLPSVLTLLVQGPNVFHDAMVTALPAALLMLPSGAVRHFTPVLYPLNLVSWSLAFELFINVAYVATHQVCSIALLVAVALLGAAGLCACAWQWGTLQVGFEWVHAAGGFARVFYGFAMGVLIQHLMVRGVAMPRLPWWLPLVAAALLFSVPAVGRDIVWGLVGCIVLVPLIVAVAVSGEPPRWLQGACAAGGVLSYALYALHVPLVGFFLRAEERLHVAVDAQSVGRAVAFTFALGLACVAAHALYDTPVRRILTKIFRRASSSARTIEPRIDAAAPVAAAQRPLATKAA